MAVQLPKKPGVYFFKAADGTVLYIGKAKSLHARVNSYFRTKKADWKVRSLIAEHAHIDHIVTGTQTEAELLEAQLIQAHRPKFNVLLRDGQPFVYLLVTQDDLPVLKIVRNQSEPGTYFGPFLRKQDARKTYGYLLQTFRLFLCNKKIERGCLDFHVGTCAGVCMPDFDRQGYLTRLELAQHALRNQSAAFIQKVHEQIGHYNRLQAFEKAQHLSEYLPHVEAIVRTLKLHFCPQSYEADVFCATSHLPKNKEADSNLPLKLQQAVGASKPIYTVDCFDVSHFQGAHLVGACIRFAHGVPEPAQFRRFRIKTVEQQDDYAALREIVQRRYRDARDLPDAVLIDGGKGQLHAVADLIPANTVLMSLAKKEEILFCPSHPDGVHLDVRTSVGRLCCALRDYAHHFAISYHRYKRGTPHSLTRRNHERKTTTRTTNKLS